MPVALKEAAQAGAGEDVGDVEQRFGLAVRAEFAFVTHEVGQHTGAVSAEDDDGLAAQIALEGLTHGTGFVMGPTSSDSTGGNSTTSATRMRGMDRSTKASSKVASDAPAWPMAMLVSSCRASRWSSDKTTLLIARRTP